MSPLGITWARTWGRYCGRRVTAFAVAVTLLAASVVFAFDLAAAEGTTLGIAAVWTLAFAKVLPVFVALVAADLWGGEWRSGRIEALLSAPVRERDLTGGKFLGVWTLSLAVIGFHLLATLVGLRLFAPAALAAVPLAGFLPGFFALALAAAFWCAVTLAVSAVFRGAAVSMAVALALTVALPRAAWYAFVRFFPIEAETFGELPLDEHMLALAGGLVSAKVVAAYLLYALVALFVATLAVAMLRHRSRRAFPVRLTMVVSALVAFAAATLAVILVARLDPKLELPVIGERARFSTRTREILANARGELTLTVFLPRNDRRFRAVSALCKDLQREAAARAGVAITVHHVDPRWNPGSATRLVRRGAKAGSVVFEHGRNLVALSVDTELGERSVADAVLRLTRPPQRRYIYWTRGHGEAAFDDFTASGMSDIARELARDGYENRPLDLVGESAIRSDCALVLVAGAQSAFARSESAMLDAYLRQGGRLLVLLGDTRECGVEPLLPTWGMMPLAAPLPTARTLTGADVVLNEFSDHPVVAPLQGLQLVLESPVAFAPSAAADQLAGADRLVFRPLASGGERVFAAAVERGQGAGEDTAIRPTRIIAVGDALFVMNAGLEKSANANRDFFLNAVNYLAGSAAITAGGIGTQILMTGMDRRARRDFLLAEAVAVPVLALLIMMTVVWRRRRG